MGPRHTDGVKTASMKDQLNPNPTGLAAGTAKGHMLSAICCQCIYTYIYMCVCPIRGLHHSPCVLAFFRDTPKHPSRCFKLLGVRMEWVDPKNHPPYVAYAIHRSFRWLQPASTSSEVPHKALVPGGFPGRSPACTRSCQGCPVLIMCLAFVRP